MFYYKSAMLINGEQKTMLVCKSLEPVEFTNLGYHKQVSGSVSTIYTTEPYIYRNFYADGYYYYWFILIRVDSTEIVVDSTELQEVKSRQDNIESEMEKSNQLSSTMLIAARVVAEQQTDENAILSLADLYEQWEPDTLYKVGKIISYGKDVLDDTQLYKVVQEHTSQAQYPPGTVESLYTPIGLSENGMPIWKKPSGAHDAYNIGDQCVHNGYVRTSNIDGNTTEPGSDARWWTKGESIDGIKPEPSDIPDWDSVETGYTFNIGTQFTYQEKTYNVLRVFNKNPGWEPQALLGDYYEEA